MASAIPAPTREGRVPEVGPGQTTIFDVPGVEPKLIGYERVTMGGCDHCELAAENFYHIEDLMPIHENCRCGVAPVFGDPEAPDLPGYHPADSGLEDSELGSRLDQTVPVEGQLEIVRLPGENLAEVDRYQDFLAQGKLNASTVKEYEDAVYTYAGNIDYEVVQMALNGDMVPLDVKYAADKIVDLFGKVPPTTRDIRVYRGMTLEANPLPGTVIESKALTSVSIDRVVAEYSASRGEGQPFIIRGTLKRGSKVINVDANFPNTKIARERFADIGLREGEQILPPGTRITLVEQSGVGVNGIPMWDAEIALPRGSGEVSIGPSMGVPEPIATSMDLVEEFSPAVGNLSDAAIDALETYSGASCYTINAAMRGYSSPGAAKSWTRIIDGLRSAFRPLKHDYTVWRGVNKPFEEIWGRLSVGGVIDDKAFLSTSTSKKVAEAFEGTGGGIIEIIVPARTPAISMEAVSEVLGWHSMGENEMILPDGTQLKITEIISKNHIKTVVVPSE